MLKNLKYHKPYFLINYNMKKIIIVWAVVFSLLWTSLLVSADDFDCTTIDRENVMELMQKHRSLVDLTSLEQESYENMLSCKPDGVGNQKPSWTIGEKPDGVSEWRYAEHFETKINFTDEQKLWRDTMKAIFTKKRAWEELTSEEEATIEEFKTMSWKWKSFRWGKPE